MRQSVIQLEKFYTSPMGRLSEVMIKRRLVQLWPDLSGRAVLGFGYTGPFMRSYLGVAKSSILAMPGAQGAVVTRSEHGIISTLVEDFALPFADASFDHVIIAHALEEAVDVDALLKEIWRVTMPEGRIVVIAANRKGLWSQLDHTPFGYGRPFSLKQLKRALSSAGFITGPSAGVLYAPPFKFFARPNRAMMLEKLGENMCRPLSGLIMVEAVKRLYAARDHGLSEAYRQSPVSGAMPGVAPTQCERP